MTARSNRAISREIDKLRKRYKRDLAKYERIAASSTGYRKSKAEAMAARSSRAIESLRYDRVKGGYSESVLNKLSSIEFSSRLENRRASASLRLSGNESLFYASTKSLWHGRTDGLSADEAIVLELQNRGYEVENKEDAVKVVSELTDVDLTQPQQEANEWERYSSELALTMSLSMM